jgi:alpha-methylacyl-CoA racemase
MTGPLHGLRVVEFAGKGAAPFAAMLLADMGAEVARIDRVGARGPDRPGFHNRGRRSVAVDLKRPEGLRAASFLVDQADCVIEGWRPGVAERLGLGPDECIARNERLVYGLAGDRSGRTVPAPVMTSTTSPSPGHSTRSDRRTGHPCRR